jgi:hypothetical protein
MSLANSAEKRTPTKFNHNDQALNPPSLAQMPKSKETEIILAKCSERQEWEWASANVGTCERTMTSLIIINVFDSKFSQGRKAVQALIWSIVSFVLCLSGSSGCHLMRIDGFLASEYPFREVRTILWAM